MKKQKRQDIIEHALLLALVVGIGRVIYVNGYGDYISNVFNHAGKLMEEANRSTENAAKEAARNTDRNFTDRMAEPLKAAVQKGKITMDAKNTAYLFAQDTPYNHTNRPDSLMIGYYVNRAKTNGNA